MLLLLMFREKVNSLLALWKSGMVKTMDCGSKMVACRQDITPKNMYLLTQMQSYICRTNRQGYLNFCVC